MLAKHIALVGGTWTVNVAQENQFVFINLTKCFILLKHAASSVLNFLAFLEEEEKYNHLITKNTGLYFFKLSKYLLVLAYLDLPAQIR